MAISEIELDIIRETLPLVRDQMDTASERFYLNLFTIEPEMRSLFRGDLAGQGMRFMSTLATIADLLAEPEALETELAALSRAHAGLGIRRAHFTPVGSALMITLGESLGADFTPAVHEAWRRAYEEIAREMTRRAGYA